MRGYDINLLLNKINVLTKQHIAQFVIFNVLKYETKCSIQILNVDVGIKNRNELYPFLVSVKSSKGEEIFLFDDTKRRGTYAVKFNRLVYIEIGKNIADNEGNAIVLRVDLSNNINTDSLYFIYEGRHYEFQKIKMDKIDSDKIEPSKSLLYKYKSFEEKTSILHEGNTGLPIEIPEFTKKAIDMDELYFATPNELNDPFEGRFGNILPFVAVAFNVFSCLKEKDKAKHSFKQIYYSLVKYYNDYGNYTDFKKNYFSTNKLIQSNNSALTITPDHYKICSLTPHYDEILMWSYYGQEHKGVCLEYDSSRIVQALQNDNSVNSFFLCGKVKYDNDRPTYNKLKLLYYYLNDDVIITLLIINVLFKKYEKWAHEDEYRFVVVNDTNDMKGITIKVPVNSFYLGCKANVSLLGSLNKRNKFHAPQASIDLTDYKLNF